MRLAHQFALENDQITADAVEATEFPHLALNETGVIEGALPEPQFLEAVRNAIQPKG